MIAAETEQDEKLQYQRKAIPSSVWNKDDEFYNHISTTFKQRTLEARSNFAHKQGHPMQNVKIRIYKSNNYFNDTWILDIDKHKAHADSKDDWTTNETFDDCGNKLLWPFPTGN